jgi:hypothetical protein
MSPFFLYKKENIKAFTTQNFTFFHLKQKKHVLTKCKIIDQKQKLPLKFKGVNYQIDKN